MNHKETEVLNPGCVHNRST